LYNYTRLPATVKVWKYSWKPFPEKFFSSYVAFLIIRGITRAQYLQYRFQSWEQVKISWSQVWRVGVWSIVVTFSFAKKSLSKPTGVLEHCREGETKYWFSNLRAFPSDRISKTT
jgi:hypothetical protein